MVKTSKPQTHVLQPLVQLTTAKLSEIKIFDALPQKSSLEKLHVDDIVVNILNENSPAEFVNSTADLSQAALLAQERMLRLERAFSEMTRIEDVAELAKQLSSDENANTTSTEVEVKLTPKPTPKPPAKQRPAAKKPPPRPPRKKKPVQRPPRKPAPAKPSVKGKPLETKTTAKPSAQETTPKKPTSTKPALAKPAPKKPPPVKPAPQKPGTKTVPTGLESKTISQKPSPRPTILTIDATPHPTKASGKNGPARIGRIPPSQHVPPLDLAGDIHSTNLKQLGVSQKEFEEQKQNVANLNKQHAKNANGNNTESAPVILPTLVKTNEEFLNSHDQILIARKRQMGETALKEGLPLPGVNQLNYGRQLCLPITLIICGIAVVIAQNSA